MALGYGAFPLRSKFFKKDVIRPERGRMLAMVYISKGSVTRLPSNYFFFGTPPVVNVGVTFSTFIG